MTFEDGRTAFAKVATDELTASWLRDEHVVYQHLLGAPFVPGYIGFHDDGEFPVLALEDLSGTISDVLDKLGVRGVVGASILIPTLPDKRIVGPAAQARDGCRIGGRILQRIG